MLPRWTRDLAFCRRKRRTSTPSIFSVSFFDGGRRSQDAACTCTCTRQWWCSKPPISPHCAHSMTLLALPCTFSAPRTKNSGRKAKEAHLPRAESHSSLEFFLGKCPSLLFSPNSSFFCVEKCIEGPVRSFCVRRMRALEVERTIGACLAHDDLVCVP